MAAGVGTALYGAAQERDARRKMAQAEEEAAGPIRSQAARQRAARMEGDAQAASDAALRAEATAASALGESGGYRAQLAATPQLQRSTQEAVMAGLERFGTTGAQLGALQEQQDLASVNQRLGGTLDRLQGAANAGRAAMLGGIGQAVGGVAQIAGGLPKKEQRGPDVAGFDTEKLQTKSMSPLQAASNAAVGLGPKRMAPIPSISGEGIGAKTYLEPKGPTSLANITIPSVNLTGSSLPPLIDTPGPNTQTTEYSGYTGVVPTSVDAALKALGKNPMYNFSDGGTVEEEAAETPGEFNHDTNPIDIIQDGEKIGEMTGGEYIFNPEQAETLRELSMQGDSPLHQFIRELLSREEFNEVEDED